MLNYSRNALFVIFGGESHLNESIEFINHCKFRKWVLVFASVAFYTIRIGDKVFKRYQMQCQILLLISWFISIFFTLMINTRHSYTIWFLDFCVERIGGLARSVSQKSHTASLAFNISSYTVELASVWIGDQVGTANGLVVPGTGTDWPHHLFRIIAANGRYGEGQEEAQGH